MGPAAADADDGGMAGTTGDSSEMMTDGSTEMMTSTTSTGTQTESMTGMDEMMMMSGGIML